MQARPVAHVRRESLRPKNSNMAPKGRDTRRSSPHCCKKISSLAFDARVWSSGVRKRRLSPPRPAASGDANAHQPAPPFSFEERMNAARRRIARLCHAQDA